MAEKKDTIDWRQAASNNSIAQFLSDFLFHPDGGKNMDGFIFETELVCGEPASRIKSLKLGTVTYKKQDDVSTYGTAHDAVENIIKSAQLSSYSFSDTERVCHKTFIMLHTYEGMKYLTFQEYFNWTVNEVIHIEFLRNMSLALLCVFLLTLIMLADLKLCAMVFVCVLFTLVSTKPINLNYLK